MIMMMINWLLLLFIWHTFVN